MIISMNIMASLLVIVILMVRCTLYDKIPKRVFVWLWGMVMIRLIFPFYLPINLSFFNISGNQGSEMAINNYYQLSSELQTPARTGAKEYNFSDWGNMLYLIWGVVMVCLFFFKIYQYLQVKRVLRESVPIDAQRLGINVRLVGRLRSAKILYSDRIKSPMTAGIFTPCIYLPTTIKGIENEELKFILLHEMAHIKRWDCLWKGLSQIVLCICWFNPFVWIMGRYLNRDIEVSCDERVLAQIGKQRKEEYANSIICWLERTGTNKLFFAHYSYGAVKERIENIMKYKKMNLVGIIVATLILGSSTIVFARNGLNQNEQNKNVEIEQVDGGSEQRDKIDAFYTIDEYKKEIKQTKEALEELVNQGKLTEAQLQETMDEMNAQLSRLIADGGKGDYVLYKPIEALDSEGEKFEVHAEGVDVNQTVTDNGTQEYRGSIGEYQYGPCDTLEEAEKEKQELIKYLLESKKITEEELERLLQ